MGAIRNRIAGSALAGALLAAHICTAAPGPAAPPEEWAPYVAQVRQAETIDGDEARCNAYPDLPGNAWRAGAAKGRCAILRAPAWSLDAIDGLLAAPEGVEELERRFAALLAAHYDDPVQRDQIFVTLFVFDDSERARTISQRWLEKAPRSAFAHVAAGMHLSNAGWKARGTAWARETPEVQLRRMRDLFARAVPLYVRALELEPRLSVACHELSGIGRQSSDALQRYAMAHCTKIDPDSYFLALERVTSAEPRWGGTDEQLRFAVAYAAARTDRNPMLGALLGEAAGYQPARADDPAKTADDIAAAARMGPSASLSSRAGWGYRLRDDAWNAFAFLSQAVRFRPRDDGIRHSRAIVLFDLLGDAAWAREDLQVALELAPGDSSHLYLLGRVTRRLEGDAAARPYFREAMRGDRRESAMAMYCQTFFYPEIDADAADACTREMVAEFPLNGEAWRLRAWALHSKGDPAMLEAVEQFERHARDVPHHRESLAEMRTRWAPELERLRAARGAGGATPTK